MKLSVIICTSGRPESLKQVRTSLQQQSFKDLEIVIVKESPLVKARDLGWRRAKGEIVAWIDDDVVADKNWAENLVKIFTDNSDVGGVSGPTLVPENLLKNRLVFWWYGKKNLAAKLWVKLILDSQPLAIGKITKIGWWSPGSNFKECLKLKGLHNVDYLEACNMSLRRKLVERVGGFDLGYKGTSEWCELDLAMKVKQLGYRLVWSSQVKVEHHVSRSGAFIKRKNWGERIKNYLKFRKKWFRQRRTSPLILKFLLMNFYFQIDWWVIKLAKQYDKKGKKLLDVGAGECRYKQYWQQLNYQSQDIKQNTNKTIDYVGEITKVPAKFDYILCIQVLEHLKQPEAAFREFKRLLKPRGKVFLTTNFIYQIHMAPDDYWRFTEYGLKYLGESVGFKVEKLAVQGGIFQALAYLLITLPLRIGLEKWLWSYWLYIIVFSPVIMIINLIAVGLDRFIKTKSLAINYGVVYRKI